MMGLAVPGSTLVYLDCLDDDQSYKWTGIGNPNLGWIDNWTSSLQSLLSPHNLTSFTKGGEVMSPLELKALAPRGTTQPTSLPEKAANSAKMPSFMWKFMIHGLYGLEMQP